MGRDFIKWFKGTGQGWVMESQVPEDVKPSLMKHLEDNDGKVGVYVYHLHSRDGDTAPIVFEGMRLGYYVRGKNPFKWNFRATAGNE